jgi:hypothetical protein
VTEPQFLTGGIEPFLIAGAVVGHDGSDENAAILEPGHRAPQESNGRRGSLRRQDLGVGKTRSVIDGDVNVLPADAADTPGSVSVDAMADPADAPQLLDVHMDQLAGAISLVPVIGWLGIEVLEPRQAMTSQDAGHRGRAQAHSSRDPGPGLSPPPHPQHLFNSIRMGLSRHPTRRGTAIDQGRLAGFQVPPLPLEGGSLRYPGRLGGPGHEHAPTDPANQKQSTGWATSGILVKLHLGSFVETVALNTSSLTDLGPDGQQTLPVNNVLRKHS